jgi:hypothetical protein
MLPSNRHPIIPEPIIPVFQYSTIPATLDQDVNFWIRLACHAGGVLDSGDFGLV